MSEPDEFPDDFPATTLHPATLHEAFDDPAAAEAHVPVLQRRVRDAPDEVGELLARGELVDLLRVLGRLDDALHEANAAVDRAEIAGTAAQVHLARLRLARVHQWRGEYADSNVVLTELLAAAQQFGPVVEAFTLQYAGENDYEQGHDEDAQARFEQALAIRERLELDEAATSRAAVEAVRQRRAGP